MSEDRTKEIKDKRTFEERVFARFDTVDERFDRVEGRLTAVEIKITEIDAKRYDTKPIWERALAEIAESRAELKAEIAESRAELKAEIAESRAELKAEIAGLRTETKTGVDGLRTEMKAEFVTVQHKMEHELRRVGRQIDVLNQTFLQIQADQRYVDRRLEELETQIEQR
jgi:hypothetical protein